MDISIIKHLRPISINNIMSNGINKVTKFNLVANIFENSIFDHLVFNTSTNIVFVFTVNLISYMNDTSKCWSWLSVKEKIQASKYSTQFLSDKYIISHGILRYILSYYTKQHSRNIEFIYNEYGKPSLENNNVHFNMSHSHNMISYIIALNHRVGIDIELHDNDLNVQELAILVFTLTEYKYFSGLDSKEKLEFFYHVWTKKGSVASVAGDL